MKAMTAAHQVLELPELLEHILFYVSEQDLLLAQRVSKTFRDVIIGSSLLQQRLFFRPALQRDVEQVSFISNPLLVKRFWPWYKMSASYIWGTWKSDAFDALQWNLNDWTFQAYAREDASWRRMLVVQPGIIRLRVWKITTDSDRTRDKIQHAELTIQPNQGLRMGILYDLVETHLCEESLDGAVYARQNTAFGVYWGALDAQAASTQALEAYQNGQPSTFNDDEAIRTHDTITLVLQECTLSRSGEPREWGSQFRSEGRRQPRPVFQDCTPEPDPVGRRWRWCGLKAMVECDECFRGIAGPPTAQVFSQQPQVITPFSERRLARLVDAMRRRRETGAAS